MLLNAVAETDLVEVCFKSSSCDMFQFLALKSRPMQASSLRGHILCCDWDLLDGNAETCVCPRSIPRRKYYYCHDR